MNELNFLPVVDEYWLLEAPAPLPYVSLAATKRVNDKMPAPTECPDCGGSVKLVNNREIYGYSVGDWPFAYHCQKCGECYVGLHSDTAIPLGYMAGKELRAQRQEAKVAFHEALKRLKLERKAGYIWLSKQMDLPLCRTHFGWFNLEQCAQALKITTEAK